MNAAVIQRSPRVPLPTERIARYLRAVAERHDFDPNDHAHRAARGLAVQQAVREGNVIPFRREANNTGETK